MNRIVIIGNGFDIAHGLLTGYLDFIEWLKKEYIIILTSRDIDRINSHPIFRFPYHLISKGSPLRKKNEAWILDILDSVNNWDDIRLNKKIFLQPYKESQGYLDLPIGYKNSLFEYSTEKSGSPSWGGFENDYKDLLIQLIEKRNLVDTNTVPRDYKIENLNLDLRQIIDLFYDYLKTQVKIPTTFNAEIVSRLYGSARTKWRTAGGKIQKYGQISAIEQEDKSNDLDHILFLNFNYTSTLENYLRKSSNWHQLKQFAQINVDDSKPITSIRYIHGDLDDNDSASLIFGYGNELDENQPILETLDDEFLKHIKSVLYTRSPYYRELIDFAEADKFDIVIYGHSCSNTDRTLLNTLFEHENCVSIQPFLHDPNNTSIYTNIYRCFKDKKLMRSRVVDQTNTIKA